MQADQRQAVTITHKYSMFGKGRRTSIVLAVRQIGWRNRYRPALTAT
jgi:hypothetical protein